MKITSSSFDHGQAIPPEFAFCKPDLDSRVALSTNRNPQLAWEDAPEGARSFVLICHDPDVPSVADDVNQEGRVVAQDLPRIDFYHWVLVDIPADAVSIEAGADSSEVTPRGKGQTPGPNGAIRGCNSYGDWFTGDPDMGGDYFGYDGPCPPWNDSVVHHYIFTIYALDIEQCGLNGVFGGPEVLAAIEGHILDEASLTGVYSLKQ
jgi:Raf kinase inhibitor-like YbhB/YbcL family protein